MRKLHRSLRQVHYKRLHNGTHVPCSLQSPHSNGIGMITSIWNLSENRTVPIRVLSHPYFCVYINWASWVFLMFSCGYLLLVVDFHAHRLPHSWSHYSREWLWSGSASIMTHWCRAGVLPWADHGRLWIKHKPYYLWQHSICGGRKGLY